MVLLPEGVGEKGFLESRSSKFRIDSSGKGMRRTSFEGPDWRQKAKTRSAYESRFSLCYHDGRIRIRRYTGGCCLLECIIARHSDLTHGVMVWGVISYLMGDPICCELRKTLVSETCHVNVLEDKIFLTVNAFARGLIIGMKTAGWSTQRVAGQVDRSECTIRNCWEQWTREGTHAQKTWSGATRKTTRREDRRIMRQALVDPTVTRSMIRADVAVTIVPPTISRHLAEANLKSKRPFRALPLTPEHRQQRLQWCKGRSM
ncbi:transposable element Tc1 transposase [Trichonephila clavipes]|nr:transposable element Tc1 transposase [Trichonephila clavipes]